MFKILYCDISKVKLGTVENLELPKLRKEYVLKITDEKRKIQSILVWKLLEYALSSFNLTNFEFFQDKSGKWSLENGEKINFSLTHSHNIVAVAVSDEGSVGLDVEKISEKIVPTKKLYTANEINTTLKAYPNFNIEEILTFLWTKKESAFKSNINYGFYTEKITDEAKNRYILTVCSEYSAEVEQINIDKIV